MKTSEFHFPSFIGFLFFTACSAIMFALSFIFGLTTLFSSTLGYPINAPAVIMFVTTGFSGALLGAASVISLLRYLNKPFAEKPATSSITGLQAAIGVAVIALILLAGSFAQSNPSINWFILPCLTVPAVAIPVWLLLRAGTNRLPAESQWRTWGVFGLSMSFTPFLLFILEIMALLVVLGIAGLFILSNPALSAEIDALSTRFMLLDSDSAEEIIKLILPYLTRPGVLLITFSIFSVILPMMEEALKPLGVWLLAGKLQSQAQGFALGALCGAGFALVETFNVSGQTDGWTSILFARIGTGAMHIAASALVGSGIFSAVKQRRYLRLLGVYLIAILLHGTWNFAALANSFSTMLAAYGSSDFYHGIATASGVGLVVLTLVLLGILIATNRMQPSSLAEDVQTAPAYEDEFKTSS